MRWIMTPTMLLLAGCINIATHLQPIDQSVLATVEGRDCVPIVFGIGIGTNTVERAKIESLRRVHTGNPQWLAALDMDIPLTPPVARIRSIRLIELEFLAFGERCLSVIGEP